MTSPEKEVVKKAIENLEQVALGLSDAQMFTTAGHVRNSIARLEALLELSE